MTSKRRYRYREFKNARIAAGLSAIGFLGLLMALKTPAVGLSVFFGCVLGIIAIQLMDMGPRNILKKVTVWMLIVGGVGGLLGLFLTLLHLGGSVDWAGMGPFILLASVIALGGGIFLGRRLDAATQEDPYTSKKSYLAWRLELINKLTREEHLAFKKATPEEMQAAHHMSLDELREMAVELAAR
ncbi:MAG: hypothetical protein AAFR21_00145 [Pseudomonadota bacterium]